MSYIAPMTLDEARAAYKQAFAKEIRLRRELEAVRWRWARQRKRRAHLDALLTDLERVNHARLAGD